MDYVKNDMSEKPVIGHSIIHLIDAMTNDRGE